MSDDMFAKIVRVTKRSQSQCWQCFENHSTKYLTLWSHNFSFFSNSRSTTLTRQNIFFSKIHNLSCFYEYVRRTLTKYWRTYIDDKDRSIIETHFECLKFLEFTRELAMHELNDERRDLLIAWSSCIKFYDDVNKKNICNFKVDWFDLDETFCRFEKFMSLRSIIHSHIVIQASSSRTTIIWQRKSLSCLRESKRKRCSRSECSSSVARFAFDDCDL